MGHIKIKGKINACRALVESMKEINNLGDLDLNERIILKPILRQ
jgi:hypothetical protein